MNRFYVAALTGRSGTGKSHAARYLAKKGITVIDGDVVAREVVEPGSRCLDALVREFSAEILHEDGTLNRRLLADICFSDPAKKERLDQITHPHIIERLLSDFDALHEKGVRFCLIEAGALIESGLYAVCDKIIMVTASEEAAVARIIARDGITPQQAETRLRAQMSADEIRDLCDVIITNDGAVAEFEAKLDILAGQLESWFAE